MSTVKIPRFNRSNCHVKLFAYHNRGFSPNISHSSSQPSNNSLSKGPFLKSPPSIKITLLFFGFRKKCQTGRAFESFGEIGTFYRCKVRWWPSASTKIDIRQKVMLLMVAFLRLCALNSIDVEYPGKLVSVYWQKSGNKNDRPFYIFLYCPFIFYVTYLMSRVDCLNFFWRKSVCVDYFCFFLKRYITF